MFDAYEELAFAECIPLQDLTGDGGVNGLAVQLGGGVVGKFQEILFWIDVGLWTDGTHAFELETSPDGSTSWDSIPAAVRRGEFPIVLSGANDEQAFYVGYRPDESLSEEYARIRVVTTGGPVTGLADVQAMAVLADPTVKPVR